MGKITFDFTVAKLKTLLPNNRDTQKLFDALCEILPKYDINTPERMAMFLGQCAHESFEFNALTENLNYSVKGLLAVFPSKFNLAQARQYAHKPEKIANRVYANKLGNGSESSGDGWKFRGQGFIQLTGKYNHLKFAEAMKMSLDQELHYIKTLNGSIEAACWFWTEHDLNKYADRLDIDGATKKINGSHRGLKERTYFVRKALVIFNGTVTAAPTILKRGMKGEAVFALQEKLSKLGYNVSIDGDYGRGTENAVKQFQADRGLSQDGKVGAKTRMLL